MKMDDDIKQLLAGVENYCTYAVEKLFSPDQQPEGRSERDEAALLFARGVIAAQQRAHVEVHYVFPNLSEQHRKILTAARFNALILGSDARAKVDETEPEMELLFRNFERNFNAAKALCEKHVKGKLVDVQRRYVEQVLFT